MKEAKFSSRREYWKSLIEEQKRSGLSQAEFCAKRGLSRSSFYNWSSTLKRDDERSALVPVIEVGNPIVEPMRIVFQNGVALHFAQKPEPEWIMEILRLVR